MPVDDTGRPWATLLEGAPGFAHALNPEQLRLDAQPDADDPAAAGLHLGAAVGLLGIELHTRRRNRVNGHVAERNHRGSRWRLSRRLAIVRSTFSLPWTCPTEAVEQALCGYAITA